MFIQVLEIMQQTTIIIFLCIALAISILFSIYSNIRGHRNRKNNLPIAGMSGMEHIREGFILIDDANNYLYSNSAAAVMIPGIAELQKGESVSSVTGWPKEIKDMESGTLEFSLSDKNTRHLKASVSPVFTQDHTFIARIVFLSDITDNVILMQKLEKAAYIDTLTGIYNRKHFFELAHADIERAIRLNHSIYTAMLDLDLFKSINDTYGHVAGDIVLKNAAAIIRQTIRSYDLVGRYGGEEFILLITDLDETMAHNLMERIRENMEYNITHCEGKEIKITCSIGLAKFEEGDTLETSVGKADKALYSVKNANRNEVRVYGSPLDSAQ